PDVRRAQAAGGWLPDGNGGPRISVGGIFSADFRRADEGAVSARHFGKQLVEACHRVRATRLFVLLLMALAAALASDWLREERVVFPAPLPEFIRIPKAP